MISPIRISVIIPVLNERDNLIPCINALKNQQLVDNTEVELLAIDNGSTDGSQALLEELAVRCIASDVKNDVYQARNTGIKLCTGSIIAFTDSHCIVNKNWIKEITQPLLSKRTDIAVGSIEYQDNASYFLKLYASYHEAQKQYIYQQRRYKATYGQGANMAVTRDLLDRIGLFKPMPCPGDTEIIHRGLKASPAARYCYVASAIVKRQQLNTLRQLLGKSRKHARMNQSGSSDLELDYLSIKEKFAVVRLCRVNNRHGYLAIIMLVCVIALGAITYQT